jgi:phthalate 4,5-dioxygenase
VDSGYRRLLNAANNYNQDRQLQKTLIYSGIKCVIPAEQDACATESMGPIYDRTKEHLGYSDKTIIALRKYLLRAVKAVEEGEDPPHVIKEAASNDFRRLRAVKGVIPAEGSWLDLPDKDDAM